MRPFKYTRATDPNGATTALAANPHAKFLAGGTNILDLMKELNRTEKTTFIFSTHDQQVMANANAIIRLADGKLAERTAASGLRGPTAGAHP